MTGAVWVEERQQARPAIERAGVAQPRFASLRGLFVAAVLLMYAALLLHAAAATLMLQAAITDSRSWRQPDPFITIAIGSLMAYCSLCGIWWARSGWTIQMKTPVAAGCCLAVWGMTLLVLDESRTDSQRAAGWAAGLATQFVLTALAAAGFDLMLRSRGAMQNHRFTILTLFVWTTLVACFLGGGRWLAGRLGWTHENFFAWGYFGHLQVVGVANALMAISISECLRLPAKWRVRCSASIALVPFAVPITLGLLQAAFGRNNIGVSPDVIAWLIMTQGIVLVATLLPLELACAYRQARVNYGTSAAADIRRG